MITPESMRIVTVVAFVILLTVGFFKRPVFATASYMILVYCKMSFYYPFFGDIKSELVFAVLIFLRLIFLKNNAEKLSLKYNGINTYLLLFTACVFLSYAVAWDRQYSWDNAVYHFIKVLILYVLILMSVDDKQDLKIFVWSFAIMFAYLAYEPFYRFLHETGGSEHIYGVNYIADAGILAGHVALANNMNQMIPIAFFLMLSAKTMRSRIISSIPLIIFVSALIGSGSRGGFVGFLCFGALLVIFSENRKKYMVYVLIGFILLLTFSETLKYTGSRIDSTSAEGRFDGLLHGIGMVRRGNIIGVGPGCYLFARARYFSYQMEAHNIYGEVIGSLGIPGTIAWIFFIRQIFINLVFAKRQLIAHAAENSFLYKLIMGIQLSVILRLIISMASHGLFYFYWYVMAALSVAVIKVVEQEIEYLPAIEGDGETAKI